MKNKFLFALALIAGLMAATPSWAESLDMRVSYRVFWTGATKKADIIFDLPNIRTSVVTPQTQPITFGSLDGPNNVFPDIASAVSYLRNDYFTYLIGEVNTASGASYTQGDVIYTDYFVRDDLAAKQPLSANLDDFADIALAPDVKTMLQAADGAAFASAVTSAMPVQLGTAAFHPESYFALASHTHANATTSDPGFLSAADKVKLNATSGTNTGDQTSVSGNAGTATALAANGSNCSAGNYARGVDASGNAENCTAVPTVPTGAVYGSPNSRSLSLATAYQCTDNTKPCMLTVTVSCPITGALLAGSTCSGEVRVGTTTGVASGSNGSALGPIQRSVSGLLNFGSSDYETKTVPVPVGGYFAIRQTGTTAGTGGVGTLVVPAAFDTAVSIQ